MDKYGHFYSLVVTTVVKDWSWGWCYVDESNYNLHTYKKIWIQVSLFKNSRLICKNGQNFISAWFFRTLVLDPYQFSKLKESNQSDDHKFDILSAYFSSSNSWVKAVGLKKEIKIRFSSNFQWFDNLAAIINVFDTFWIYFLWTSPPSVHPFLHPLNYSEIARNFGKLIAPIHSWGLVLTPGKLSDMNFDPK